jgi:hypothetical protein
LVIGDLQPTIESHLDRMNERLRPIRTWIGLHGLTLLVTLIALAVTAASITYGPRAVGGADEYGYVSQADLWLDGKLTIDQSFVRQTPWHYAEWHFAPLGYRPHPLDRGLLVPAYSPGLPILLALAKAIGGQDALFFVVPLSAGLLILGTYRLGVRLGARRAGAIAAWFVATSPVVLFMSTSTMSDVPVAAAWTWAFCCLLGGSRPSAAAAGLLSSLAILIRPNLAPLAGVLALHYVFLLRDVRVRRSALVRFLTFSVALIPGVAVVAAINAHLYGSPTTSGYGALSELFSLSRVWANARLYFGWFAEAHTPIALCGFVAIFVPLRQWRPGMQTRELSLVIATFVSAVWLIYCAWLVFDAWWFMRFLLSSWPFLMLGIGGIAMAGYAASPRYARPLVVLAVVALGIYQVDFANDWRAFGSRDGRRRFVAAARVVRDHTDRYSVIISNDHSGSIRYYGGRMTMNYAWMNGGPLLDSIVEWLQANGARTYLAVEDWEMPEVRRRFAGSVSLRALDGAPVATYEEPGKMLLFDLTEPRAPDALPDVERDMDIGPRAVRPAPAPRVRFAPPPGESK